MTGGDIPEDVRERLVARRLAYAIVEEDRHLPDETTPDYAEEEFSPESAVSFTEGLLDAHRKAEEGDLLGSSRGAYNQKLRKYENAAGRSFEDALAEAEEAVESGAVRELAPWVW